MFPRVRSLGTATVVGMALAVFLAACSGAPQKAAPAADTKVAADAKGEADAKVAPQFELKDVQGNLYKSSSADGTVRLVDFWATWCAPCRAEIPMFKEFQATYGPKGFTLVGIAMDDEGVEKVGPFVDEMKIPYLTLIGDEGVADKFGGVVGFPTKFLIDRQGHIVDYWVGEVPRSVLEKKIQALL